MRTTAELLEMFLNDEKLVSLKAPIEALGPELSEPAIDALKNAGIETVGDFQRMEPDRLDALCADEEITDELWTHWFDVQED